MARLQVAARPLPTGRVSRRSTRKLYSVESCAMQNWVEELHAQYDIKSRNIRFFEMKCATLTQLHVMVRRLPKGIAFKCLGYFRCECVCKFSHKWVVDFLSPKPKDVYAQVHMANHHIWIWQYGTFT